ncbi:MAG: hypothetical protein RLZZ621_2030 [Gemmatimonadota bacterium]
MGRSVRRVELVERLNLGTMLLHSRKCTIAWDETP